MLMPKRVKHRKQMKGRMSGKPCRGIEISFGELVYRPQSVVGLIHARLKQPVLP